jgi:hypothetical protein
MHDVKFAKESLKESDDSADDAHQQTCTCSTPNQYLAYESHGVIKCTAMDCAYYMQNFIDGILRRYEWEQI